MKNALNSFHRNVQDILPCQWECKWLCTKKSILMHFHIYMKINTFSFSPWVATQWYSWILEEIISWNFSSGQFFANNDWTHGYTTWCTGPCFAKIALSITSVLVMKDKKMNSHYSVRVSFYNPCILSVTKETLTQLIIHWKCTNR